MYFRLPRYRVAYVNSRLREEEKLPSKKGNE